MGFESLGRENNNRNLSFLRGNHMFDELQKDSSKHVPSKIDARRIKLSYQKIIRRNRSGRIILAIVIALLLFSTILFLTYLHFDW